MLRTSQVSHRSVQQGIQEHKRNVWVLSESVGKQCCNLPALGWPAWQQCGVRAATQVCRDNAAGRHVTRPYCPHPFQQPHYSSKFLMITFLSNVKVGCCS